MCGCLVLSMVPSMFSCLELGQPANGKNAYDKGN